MSLFPLRGSSTMMVSERENGEYFDEFEITDGVN